MSKTGNNKGFTLLEVMVASSVLALGILMIFESFFSSLDAYNGYFHYLNVCPWADEKIWEAQTQVAALGPSAHVDSSGVLTLRKKDFNWSLTCDTGEAASGLYKLQLTVSWKEKKKTINLLRSAYAVYQLQS